MKLSYAGLFNEYKQVNWLSIKDSQSIFIDFSSRSNIFKRFYMSNFKFNTCCINMTF